LNTPSLRLEESNANLTPNFYIDRDIPRSVLAKDTDLTQHTANKLAFKLQRIEQSGQK